MLKKERIMKFVVNGTLFAVIAALGITLYWSGVKEEKKNMKEEQNSSYQEEEMANETDTNSIQTEIEKEEDYLINQPKEEIEGTQEIEENISEEMVGDEELSDADAYSNLYFDEESLMEWPISGNILMDYSTDKTTYFKTLDQYKVNPAIVIQADVDTEVKAAATGVVTAIENDAETGTTITMNLGNGYEISYGQLGTVTVYQGEQVTVGRVIGYITEPTKYYSLEGSNLYFSMKRDGEAIDPVLYLP